VTGRRHLEREALLSRLFPAEVARPKLGRYDVLEFVGEGGMGTVFAAYDPRLDRRVAVKLIKHAAHARKERRARLLREAQALARLSHPNIVTVHEGWEEHGEIYIAMEFVEGESLARWQRRPHTWREVVDAYRQAGEGLRAVHGAGLVHRDFKPHNVMRRAADGVVKLLDFGLARIEDERASTVDGHSGHEEPAAPTDDEDQLLTQPGTLVGTLAYMAPEQLAGQPADARSDQFGFAVSLWEGLFGQRPFVREREVGSGDVEERPLPLPRDHGVPGWVRQVLERGMAREPRDRYGSMAALLRDLGRDPAARRRRVVLAGVAVLASMGGALGQAELRAEPHTTCMHLQPLLGEQQREAVRRGVVEAGGAQAEPMWSRLQPRLEAYDDEHPPPPSVLLQAVQLAWRQGDLARARAWSRRAREQVVGDPRAAMWTVYFWTMEARAAAAEGDASVLDEIDAEGIELGELDRAVLLLALGRAAEAEAILAPLVPTGADETLTRR